MAIFATLNVGRNGVSKSGAVKQLLDMCNATTCALQELDINRYSMCSWVADWRAKGFHALLSSPCFGFCRVGIVSTQPLKPIQLSDVDEPDRVVAAISEFELPDQQGVLKLIVCSNAAEFALQSVGSNPRACVARSQPWTPVKLRPLPKAAQEVEPILLSRACRLHRRFVQLQRDPGQVKLHRVCLRNLVSLADRIPEIRHWHHCDGPQLVQALSDACVRMESEHKRSCIQAWRDNIHGNLAKQVSWIKRRSQLLADIAEEPLGPQGSINAIHPATIVSQQEQTLGSLWTSVEPPNLPDLQRLLHQMGGHSAPVDLNLVWDAASLRKLAKSMCGKSAGIDGWSAEALVLLPEQWWTGFAALWNSIWCTGNVPSIWKYARVALVPKDAADWRPLAIASVLWRIGASFLVKGLRPWLSSVLDHRVSGGVPGRSVCHAVLRIVDAIHNDAQCIMVAQDLAKFFDSLQLEQVILIAMHFGAPPQLVPLLKSFYHNCWRLFTCRGVCSDSASYKRCAAGLPAKPCIGRPGYDNLVAICVHA